MFDTLPDEILKDFISQVNNDVAKKLQMKASLLDDPAQKAALFADVGLWTLAMAVTLVTENEEQRVETTTIMANKLLERSRALQDGVEKVLKEMKGAE